MTENWWYEALEGSTRRRKDLAMMLSTYRVGDLLGSTDMELTMLGLSARELRRLRAIERLVGRSRFELATKFSIHTPDDAAKSLIEMLWTAAVESVVVAVLDVQHRLMLVETVHRGGIAECLADPREIFRPAVITRGSAIVVGHNHPSGNPAPSPADLALTERLISAGHTLGIPLLDHLVVGGIESPQWTSLAQEGALPAGISARTPRVLHRRDAFTQTEQTAFTRPGPTGRTESA